MKKLIPALCLLLISAVVMSTASFAWFSMNTAVTAKGMTVNAMAESGIVISNNNETKAWNAEASSTIGETSLLPTSTSDGATWYHNSSKSSSTATGSDVLGGTYATVTNGDKNYYVDNVFYIQSATTSALAKELYIKQVTITPPTTQTSANLDKALRVLIKVKDQTGVYIYAPDEGSTLTYTVNGTTSVTAKNAAITTDTKIDGIASIPANTGTPIEVHIFVYFEGEDAKCISDNVAATIDQMQVSVQFEAKDKAAS